MPRAFAPSVSVPEQLSRQPVLVQRPSREEAMEAVRTLLRWAGDDPNREGLLGTPDRVVRSYQEFFSGYGDDPVALLQRTFEETNGYDEIVALKDIRFESHCEHHIAPIIGKVHVAYLPNKRVVGISTLARLVAVYARRLQIRKDDGANRQHLDGVQPKGVAVMSRRRPMLTTRGVHKPRVTMVTSRMLGAFRDDPLSRPGVLSMIGTRAAQLDNVDQIRPPARSQREEAQLPLGGGRGRRVRAFRPHSAGRRN
jgi:GTP cyclohydrolase I